MNRNAISSLVEVSLFAGIAIWLAGAGSVLAQDQATGANLAATAPKAQVRSPAVVPSRMKVATQKLMRNPWEKTVEMASTQPRSGR